MMMLSQYSHCFTKCQLELIIDDYLGLQPYYKILATLIRQYVKELTSNDHLHNKQKPHPIKIYTKDINNKNIQEQFIQPEHSRPNYEHTIMSEKTTYSQINPYFYYLYPLEVIVHLLESQNFYKSISKNVLINQLLTHQNIDIIREVLTIVSEQMSKKIKSTLSSKETKNKTKTNQKKSSQNNLINQYQQIKSLNHDKIIQSKIQIIQSFLFQDDQETEKKKISRKQTKNYTLCNNNNNENKISKQQFFYNLKNNRLAQDDCKYCSNYIIYLQQINGYNNNDWSLDKLSKQTIKYLIVISKAISHFTIYLTQENSVEIPNSINIINRILNQVGIVITEDIYNSQLNPKNQVIIDNTTSKPKNLIEYLSPYFNSYERRKKKQKNKSGYEIHELFKMIIYSPQTSQVSRQLKSCQLEHFQKQSSLLNNMQKNQKAMDLLKKQYQQLKQFEKKKIQILKNTIDIKPIYKQIHITDVHDNAIDSKPELYSLAVNKKTIDIKFIENRPQTVSHQLKDSINSSKKRLNKSNTIDIIAETAKTITDKQSVCFKSSKNLKKRMETESKSKKQTQGVYLQDEMQKNIKKNLLIETSNVGKSININKSTEQSQFNFNKDRHKVHIEDMELTDQNFKQIIKNIENTKKKKSSKDSLQDNITESNILKNFLKKDERNKKSKPSNGYSNSLSQFIVRKQEKQQIECIQKMEKELYNKQLLNGQFIQKQVYNEFWLGDALLFDNYQDAMFLKNEISIYNEQSSITKKKYYPESDIQLKTFQTILRNTNKSKIFKQQQNSTNFIKDNSRKYNDSGLIRNTKYSKNIKNQLINNSSCLFNDGINENISKNQLAKNKLKNTQTNLQKNNINNLYNDLLNKRLKQNQQGLNDKKQNKFTMFLS